ncbi:MAG TPA: hypothetical protein V6D03_07830 [Candidatus Caenarcaniphilales bacterium]
MDSRDEVRLRHSVPTFIIGERILSGLLSKEKLRQEINVAVEENSDSILSLPV